MLNYRSGLPFMLIFTPIVMKNVWPLNLLYIMTMRVSGRFFLRFYTNIVHSFIMLSYVLIYIFEEI